MKRIDLNALKASDPIAIIDAFDYLAKQFLPAYFGELTVEDCEDVAAETMEKEMPRIAETHFPSRFRTTAYWLARGLLKRRSQMPMVSFDDTLDVMVNNAAPEGPAMIEVSLRDSQDKVENKLAQELMEFRLMEVIPRLHHQWKHFFEDYMAYLSENPDGNQTHYSKVRGINPNTVYQRFDRLRDAIQNLKI